MKLDETASLPPDSAPVHSSGSVPAPTASSKQHQTCGDFNSSFGERALSALGAAVVSAILVNPLDVAKTRLQAQAAEVPKTSTHQVDFGRHVTTLSQIREGLGRLWIGTNASLALAIPTVGIYLPCYEIFRNWIEDATKENAPSLAPYAPLVAGSIARSMACIVCSPIELAKTRMQAFKELSDKRRPGIKITLAGILSPNRSYKSVNNRTRESKDCSPELGPGLAVLDLLLAL